MSKLLIALLSFILGCGIGMIIMSCLVIAKESDRNEQNQKNK